MLRHVLSFSGGRGSILEVSVGSALHLLKRQSCVKSLLHDFQFPPYAQEGRYCEWPCESPGVFEGEVNGGSRGLPAIPRLTESLVRRAKAAGWLTGQDLWRSHLLL